MKTEILRIQHLKAISDTGYDLEGTSVYLYGGDIIGLQGLVHSGKNVLSDVIRGKNPFYVGELYWKGMQVSVIQDIQAQVYNINAENYVIEDWTVAEYIGLLELKCKGYYNEKSLIKLIDGVLAEVNINISASRKIGELSEIEKRMVDLVKAYKRKVSIIIIEDEFESCSYDEICQFKNLMDRIVTNNIAVLVNSNSNMVSEILPTHYIIFRHGRIAKKIKKEIVKNVIELECYMLEPKTELKLNKLDKNKKVSSDNHELFMRIKDVILDDDSRFEIDLEKGKIYNLIISDHKKKEDIFDVISGRNVHPESTILISGREKELRSISDFVENRIVAIAKMGDAEELLNKMTISENLVLPSLIKLGFWEYVLNERKIRKMLNQYIGDSMETNTEVEVMTRNEYINLMLERWLMFKPKTFILLEPFVKCDTYGVSLVKSFLTKFVNVNCTVVILNGRSEYMEDVADYVLTF